MTFMFFGFGRVFKRYEGGNWIWLMPKYGEYPLGCIRLKPLAVKAAFNAATWALLLIFCFFNCEIKCSGGWKYLHVSLEHLPFIKSTHTMTNEFSASIGQLAGGCASWHSDADFGQLPFWKSL